MLFVADDEFPLHEVKRKYTEGMLWLLYTVPPSCTVLMFCQLGSYCGGALFTLRVSNS